MPNLLRTMAARLPLITPSVRSKTEDQAGDWFSQHVTIPSVYDYTDENGCFTGPLSVLIWVEQPPVFSSMRSLLMKFGAMYV